MFLWNENFQRIFKKHIESNRHNDLLQHGFYKTNTDYQRNWYLQNKENVLENANKKITCQCGSIITHQFKAEHLKTKKHLDKMSQTIIL